MADFHISGKGVFIFSGRQYFRSFTYTSGYQETFPLVFFPTLLNDFLYHSYSVEITVKDNKLFSLSHGARAVIRNKNNIEIFMTPEPAVPYHNPLILTQKEFTHGDSHLITAYSEGNPVLICESGKNFLPYKLPPLIKELNIRCQSTGSGGLILLQGKVNLKDYLLIVQYTDEYQPICELTADNIKVTENGILCTTVYQDMLQRSVVNLINPLSDEPPATKNINYKYSAHDYPPEMLPYLMLEAILADCRDEYLSYLSPSFPEDYETVKNMLGEFDMIYDASLPVIGIYNSAEHIATVRYFNFNIRNNLIEKINAV